MPIKLLSSDPMYFFLWLLAIIMSFTVHEFSYAWAGWLQGDRTAHDAGRLNLNPFNHIDWMGFILIVLAGFGWAKPTPFNPYNLRNQKWGPVIIAGAGPLSNIVFAIFMAGTARFVLQFIGLEFDNLLITFLLLLTQVNVSLALFNLLPIPPLDGSRWVTWWLADRRPDLVMQLEQYGIWILLGILLFADTWLLQATHWCYELILGLFF